jgi:hypothetical protein
VKHNIIGYNLLKFHSTSLLFNKRLEKEVMEKCLQGNGVMLQLLSNSAEKEIIFKN